MRAYLDILETILSKGTRKTNRTGIDTIGVHGVMFKHDMQEGFPVLTTKKLPVKAVAGELEFFIKGKTDKRWLQERGIHIWDEWCTPKKVPYSNTDPTAQARMAQEPDLGPVYGFQWRHFGATYQGIEHDYSGEGTDQLAEVLARLKTKPDDRRMIVTAWNPKDVPDMALPACHYGFQVLVRNGKLDLLWNQRSIDTFLGLPFNIASYGLLLHLMAKEVGLQEGELTGFLADTHLYVNHIDHARLQLEREPRKLPRMVTERFTSLQEWNYLDSKLEDYNPHPHIKAAVAI